MDPWPELMQERYPLWNIANAKVKGTLPADREPLPIEPEGTTRG
jgi:hypothetical protein